MDCFSRVLQDGSEIKQKTPIFNVGTQAHSENGNSSSVHYFSKNRLVFLGNGS